MFSLNRAQVIGNVTSDSELKSTASGQSVANFGVATNRKWKDKDGNEQEQTEFHSIVVWGKQADTLSNWIRKGAKIFVEGRLQTRSWEDQSGSKHYKTEIMAENIILLGSPKTKKEDASEEEEIDIEEIPF